MSSSAVTVAERGCLSSSATSPKTVPGENVARRLDRFGPPTSIFTLAVPLAIMKSERSWFPSLMITSPAR